MGKTDYLKCPHCDGQLPIHEWAFESRIKQLEAAIDEVRQTQDMLYDEHYDLQAWRDNHIISEQIFNKALEGK